MNEAPRKNEHRSTKPGSRRPIACALILAAATVLWLVATASASEHESVRLFGLWRTRHVLVGCLGAWLTLISASFFSRKALFRALFGTILAISAWLGLEAVGLVGLVDYRTAFRVETGPNVLGKKAAPNIDVAGRVVVQNLGPHNRPPASLPSAPPLPPPRRHDSMVLLSWPSPISQFLQSALV